LYEFRAIFEPYDVRLDRLPGQPDTAIDGLARVFDNQSAAPTYLFLRGNEAMPVQDQPLSPAVPSILGDGLAIEPVSLPPQAYYPALRPFEQQEALTGAAAQVQAAMAALAAAQESLRGAEAQLAAVLDPGAPVAEPAVQVTLEDDFSAARPEIWTVGAGQWEHRDGRLVQSQTGDSACRLTSVATHPGDFSATFRFRILDGQMWKSVGLSFDVTDSGDYNGVYLSAVAGGPKAQVYLQRSGGASYPADAARALPIELEREYTLGIAVRGTLLNVSVDGQLAIAYRLPDERREGRFALWTFDAAAEFLAAKVETLPSQATLVEAGEGAPLPPPAWTPELATAAVDAARLALGIADRGLAAAEANAAAVAARIAADKSRYADPPAADAEGLATAANAAERQLAAASAEQAILMAEQQLFAAQAALNTADPNTQQAVTTAETALAQAKAALTAAQESLSAPPAATYTPLGPVYPATSTGRRTALARWIGSRQNPLSARVAVNHIWLRHFGEPLVPTVFDFGLNGKRPTHPDLLDWLAVEFMDSGWSMKHVHRQIVLSTAYRRDSAFRPDDPNVAIDPDNHQWWRCFARRAESEAVRDSVLAVAGSLDTTLGGPDIDQALGLTVPRRSIYFRHSKEKQVTMLSLFDAPGPTECYRRNQSIAPQQALALANSSLALAQSRVLAGKLTLEAGAGMQGDAAFVVAAYETVLSRAPSETEVAECRDFLGRQAALLASGGLEAFANGQPGPVPPSPDPAQRARENLVHVLLNHHEFVTLR
jgi:hypothetical protein